MRRRKLRVKKVALVLIFIIFIAACIFIFKGVNGTNGSLFSQSKQVILLVVQVKFLYMN